MKTALIHNPIYLKHDTGIGHPETPKRYELIMNTLRSDEEFWNSLHRIEAEKISRGIIQAIHTKKHFDTVKNAFAEGTEHLDADTTISMHSVDASVYGAGGACGAVDAVMAGEAKNAFVDVRPPGHHATGEHAMG